MYLHASKCNALDEIEFVNIVSETKVDINPFIDMALNKLDNSSEDVAVVIAFCFMFRNEGQRRRIDDLCSESVSNIVKTILPSVGGCFPEVFAPP